MWSAGVLRRAALVAGAAAVMTSGTLVACSSKEKPADSTPSTGAANVQPTEKANVGSFRPTVKARPAPTGLPGNVITGN